MRKVLVVFCTRSRGTKKMADRIAEGIRMGSDIEVDIVNVTNIKNEADIDGYDGYVFGSATYHGDMMQGMKTFLFLAEKADLEGKDGGSFGSFGWSGEATDRIYDTMKNIFKMEMVSGPLRLQYATREGEIPVAQNYGKEITEKL